MLKLHRRSPANRRLLRQLRKVNKACSRHTRAQSCRARMEQPVEHFVAEEGPGAHREFCWYPLPFAGISHGSHWKGRKVGDWGVGDDRFIAAAAPRVVCNSIIAQVDSHSLKLNMCCPRRFTETDHRFWFTRGDSALEPSARALGTRSSHDGQNRGGHLASKESLGGEHLNERGAWVDGASTKRLKSRQ